MASRNTQIKYRIGFQTNKVDLNKIKSQLEQLKKLTITDLVKINQTDASHATQMLGNIKGQIMNIEAALRSAYNAKLNTVNIEQFNAALVKNDSSLQQLYSTLKQGGAAGQNAFRTLSNEVLKTNVQLKQSQTLMGKISTTLANTIKWNIASTAINSVTQSIQQAWGFTKNLDTSLNDIRIVTEKSAEEMGKFAVQANQAASALGKTTRDYTQASLIYYQAGLSDEEVAARTNVTLKTANVTRQSTAEVSQQLTAVWNGFQIDAANTQLAVDKLAAVAASTASDLEQLSTGMSKVAAAANAMGMTEDQLAAALSTIISVTRQAPESVGTALKTILARITDIKAGIAQDGVDLGRYSGKMAALGFNVLDVNDNLRDMGTVIEEIGGRWQTLTREQQISLAQTMAGQRQYSNLIALFDNFEEYNRALSIAQNAAGTLQTQQDIYMESTRAHLDQMTTATEKLYQSILQPDSINPLIDVFTKLIGLVNQFVDSIGGGAGILVNLGALASDTFTKQIAGSITTAINNSATMKANLAEIKSKLLELNQMQGLQGMDGLTSGLLQQREEMLTLASHGILNPEETARMQQVYNDMVEKANALGTATKVYEETVQRLSPAIDKTAKSWKEQDEAFRKAVKGSAEEQQKIIDNFYQEVTQAQKLQQQLNQNKDVFQKLERANKDFPKLTQAATASLQNYLNKLQQMAADNGPAKQHAEQIKKLQQEFQAAAQSESPNILVAKLQEIAQKAKQIAENARHGMQAAAEDLPEQLANNAGAALSRLQQADEELTKTKGFWGALLDPKKREDVITGIGNIANGLTRYAAVLNNVKNLGKIWSNEDLTTGEKIFQTITSVTMVISNLIPAVSMLNTGFTKLIAVKKMANNTAVQGAAAESAHAGALTAVGVAAHAAKQGVQALGAAIAANPLGAFLTVLAAAVAAFNAITGKMQQTARKQEELRQKELQAQRVRRQAIKNEQDFLKQLKKLNDQYGEGKIVRAQLRAQIEKLSQKYGIESSSIEKLIGNYQGLADKIRQTRIEKEKENAASLEVSQTKAKDSVVAAASAGQGFATRDNRYVLEFGSGFDGGNYAEPEVLINALKKIGGKQERVFDNGASNIGHFFDNKTITFNRNQSADSIVRLYDQLNAILNSEQIRALSDSERAKSSYYNEISTWVEGMKDEVDYLRSIQQSLRNSKTQQKIYESSSLDKLNTNTGINDYIRIREDTINELKRSMWISNEQATAAVDNYLKQDYDNLYNQYNEKLKFFEQLPIKAQTKEALKALQSLNDEQFNFLTRLDLTDITVWEQLEGTFNRISQISFENLDSLYGGSPEQVQQQAATSYAIFSSLEQQIRGGKQISEKQLTERVLPLAPQLEKYFTMMANGQYKMTGDAQEFYNKVNSLKINGFIDAIDATNREIERLQGIQQKNFDYDALSRQEGSRGSSLYYRDYSKILDGANADELGLSEKKLAEAKTGALVNYDVVQNQLEYLKAVHNSNEELQAQIRIWQDLTKSHNISEEAVKRIDELIAQAGDQTQNAAERIQQLIQLRKEEYEQMYDAMFPTDSDIKPQALESLKDVLQELAPLSDQLANSLENDARAADSVAEAILRFNNAIEDVVKNYEDWIAVLTNENLTTQQLAERLPELRDAYADLLDLEGSSLSTEFLRSAQNLELMKAAIDGNIDAYDELMAAARQDIISHIEFDPEDVARFQGILDLLEEQKFHELEVGVNLNDENFIAQLQDLINNLDLAAQEASDLLHSAFGIDAEVVQQTRKQKDKKTVTGFEANATVLEIPDGFNPVNGERTPYRIPSVRFEAKPVEYEDTISATGFGLKILNARKASGGKIKWKHSSQGAGAAGTKRRAEQAEKAKAKTKEVKPDTSTKDPKKSMKDSRDIYHDINIELSDIARELERVQKQQDKLYGKQLIDNLNKQTDILEKQKVRLRQKLELQRKDLAQQREALKLMGATFNEAGHISNYFDILGHQQGVINGLTAQYNGIVERYNATTDKETKEGIKKQLELSEKALKDADDYYKQIENAIKAYDSLESQMEDIGDDLTDIAQQQIELNIRRFNMQVDIRLEMGEARRDWNKFLRDISDDLDPLINSSFDNLLSEAGLARKQAETYFEGGENSQLAEQAQHVNDILRQMEIIDNGGESKWFGTNMAQAKQALEEYFDKLKGSMTDVKAQINAVHQAYLDMYDDIKDQIDDQIDDYQFVNGLIEHQADLLQLLYGDKQYAALQSFYTSQHQNQLQQVDMLRQAIDLVKERWQYQEKQGNTEAAKKLKQQYKDLVNDLNALVETSVKTLQDKYTAAINEIFDTLDKRVTGGLGTDYIQMEWELINKNANEYLDTINSAYAIQELQSKYQKAIDGADSVKNQKTLKNLMDEQLNNLKARDKLTQYDVDRAEKLLQIEQARMALEETRNSKTSLRLKRDAQGNYSYVYSADEDEVEDRADELARLQNELYNFDKNAYQKNLEDMLSAWKEFQNRYKEIVLDTSLSEEERVRQLTLLREQYGEYINFKAEENKKFRVNLMDSAFIEYAALYEGDYQAYKDMHDAEKELFVGDLIPTWRNGLVQMADYFAGPEGFVPACEQAFNKIVEATHNYQAEIKALQEAANTDFELIRTGSIDPTTQSFKLLIGENDNLIKKILEEQIPAVDNLKKQVDLLLSSYDQVWQKASDAATKAQQALDAYREAMAGYAEANQAYEPPTPPQIDRQLPAAPQNVEPAPIAATPPATSPATGTTDTPAASGDTKRPSQKDTTKDIQTGILSKYISLAEGIAANIYYGGSWSTYYQAYGRSRSYLEQMFEQFLGQPKKKSTKFYDQVMQALGRIRLIEPPTSYADYYKKRYDPLELASHYGRHQYNTSAFDTGGYTGAWGPEGRVAMLHQKQLVLNASDTKNMLDSVSILRNIVQMLGGSINSKLSGLNGGFKGPINDSADLIEQNVHINASFPNVNTKKEIEDAFSDLMSLAAQRALKR